MRPDGGDRLGSSRERRSCRWVGRRGLECLFGLGRLRYRVPGSGRNLEEGGVWSGRERSPRRGRGRLATLVRHEPDCGHHPDDHDQRRDPCQDPVYAASGTSIGQRSPCVGQQVVLGHIHVASIGGLTVPD